MRLTEGNIHRPNELGQWLYDDFIGVNGTENYDPGPGGGENECWAAAVIAGFVVLIKEDGLVR